MSFEDFVKQMLVKSNLLTATKLRKYEAQIDSQSKWGDYVPRLSMEISTSEYELYQNSTPKYDTDLTTVSYGVSLDGSLPQYGLGYSLDYTKNSQDQDSILLSPAVDSEGEIKEAQLSFDLLRGSGFLVGGLFAKQEQYEYHLASAEYEQLVVESVLNSIKLYLQVTLAQSKIEHTIRFKAQSQNLYQSYQKLFQEGRVSKVELLSAQLELYNQELSLLELEANLLALKRELVEFASFDLGNVSVSDLTFEPINSEILMTTPEFSGVEELSKNLDLALIERRLDLSRIQIRKLNNDLLPKLEIFGGYLSASNPVAEPLSDLDVGKRGGNVGIRFSMPLRNVAAEAALKKEKIAASQYTRVKKASQEKIKLVIESLRTELTFLERQKEFLSKSLELSLQRYKAALPLIHVESNARADIFFYYNHYIEVINRLSEIDALLLSRRADILYALGILDYKKLLGVEEVPSR